MYMGISISMSDWPSLCSALSVPRDADAAMECPVWLFAVTVLLSIWTRGSRGVAPLYPGHGHVAMWAMLTESLTNLRNRRCAWWLLSLLISGPASLTDQTEGDLDMLFVGYDDCHVFFIL